MAMKLAPRMVAKRDTGMVAYSVYLMAVKKVMSWEYYLVELMVVKMVARKVFSMVER